MAYFNWWGAWRAFFIEGSHTTLKIENLSTESDEFEVFNWMDRQFQFELKHTHTHTRWHFSTLREVVDPCLSKFKVSGECDTTRDLWPHLFTTALGSLSSEARRAITTGQYNRLWLLCRWSLNPGGLRCGLMQFTLGLSGLRTIHTTSSVPSCIRTVFCWRNGFQICFQEFSQLTQFISTVEMS